ncbi:class A beta-lactamase [Rhodococcus artemisiae]|uniref:Beta-lactamase n=1 Tax=Rhodococcus artemisiae TaxID=714159 RepID=A0ABU7LG36_9NOCA|nr:class A beta-lactamase [Rhodococcus artemisiae]MEE2060513.1 class A beta-lactamase [Rhodococcus artemisiae]
MTQQRTALSRRWFLNATLVAASVPVAAACGAPSIATAPEPTSNGAAPETEVRLTALDERLAEIENRHAVRLGVLAHAPGSGRTYTHRGDERFAMCSTFKVYAAAGILQLESQGRLRLDDTVAVDPGDIVVNSPVTSENQGRVMTYAQLCEAALTRSDNTAGNLLLRRLGGPDAVTTLARSVDDHATRLDRWEPELNDAARGDERDTTTAAGLARGYRELLLGSALDPARQRILTAWMRASTTSEARMRAGLPSGWVAADKSGGGYFATLNDAGVVWSPDGEPLVLVILSDTTTGDVDAPFENAPVVDTTAALVSAMGAVP